MSRPDGITKNPGKRCAALGAIAALVLSTLSVEAARFFRYADDNGRLVLSHTIPNDRVRMGYDIVDEHGRLIQRVDPQLSDSDYEAKLAREAAQADCDRELTRVRRLYQTPQDIDYAETKDLQSIDTRIANARANLNHVRNQRRELEQQAAAQDLSGASINKLLLDRIESARLQQQNLEDEIAQRRSEKEEARAEYDYHRQVFALRNCSEGLPLLTASN
ncbi:MAG: hypothetical protein AAF513_01760 [Pseudomonadota bacterium]